MKKLIFAFDKDEIIKIFIDFNTDLLKNKQSNNIHNTFGFDITFWVESKIVSLPMSEIMHKRALEKYPQIFSVEI